MSLGLEVPLAVSIGVAVARPMRERSRSDDLGIGAVNTDGAKLTELTQPRSVFILFIFYACVMFRFVPS